MTYAAKAFRMRNVLPNIMIIAGIALLLPKWFDSRQVPLLFFVGVFFVYSLYLVAMAFRLRGEILSPEPSDLDRTIVEMRKRDETPVDAQGRSPE